MLPRGTLIKVQDFFFHGPGHEREMMRAGLEFFNLRGSDTRPAIYMNDVQSWIFTEWLTFDFRLQNGKSLIEEYCDRNTVTFVEQKIYHDLLATNWYGFFEVRDIVIGESLVLRDLKTNKDYLIKEKMGTYRVKRGNLFFGRLAMVDGHWNLVGADGPVIPMAKMTKSARDIYLNDKTPMTPKMNYDLAADGGEEMSVHKIDSAQAKKAFEKVLEKTGLVRFVSVDIVARWCKEFKEINASSKISSLLFGLSAGREEPMDENFLQVFTDFYSTVPQDALKSKSPQEVFEKRKGKPLQLVSDVTALGGEKWRPQLQKAHDFMQAQNYRKAVDAFEKTFLLLKKESAVSPDTYRFYANTAICYFNYGQPLFGKAMLAISLLLNPNYDFGKKMERDYKEGKYEMAIDEGMWIRAAHGLRESIKKVKGSLKKPPKISKINKEIIEEIQKKIDEISQQETKSQKRLGKTTDKYQWEDLMKSPSLHYYQFVKELGINLKTDTLTKSQILTYGKGGEVVKVGRNEPCVCGSGKKFKKCCGK